jgi:hypothetical protein
VADLIANGLRFGTSGEPGIPPLHQKSWDAIGVPATMLADVLREVEEHYETAVQVMALDAA